MATSDDVARAQLAVAEQLGLLAAVKAWQDALPRVCLVASAQVSRADTAPKVLFVIPAGYEAHMLVVNGQVGADAIGTAILDIGKVTPPAALFVSGWSVLGPAGVGQRLPPALKLGVVTGADVEISGRYTETGTPSTTGGPWTVTLFYSKAGS